MRCLCFPIESLDNLKSIINQFKEFESNQEVGKFVCVGCINTQPCPVGIETLNSIPRVWRLSHPHQAKFLVLHSDRLNSTINNLLKCCICLQYVLLDGNQRTKCL